MGCKISDIHFLPYVGENYANSLKKILFLGESHYNEDTGIQKTREVIEEYLNGYNYRFFNNAFGAVFGITFSRKYVGENIAFYNYIQEIVGSTARIRPTNEMWENAKKPFLNILETYLPDIVICCGKALYNHLPDSPDGKSQHGVSFTDGKLWMMRYNYIIGAKEIPLYAIRHPSSVGFNALKYYELLRKYI